MGGDRRVSARRFPPLSWRMKRFSRRPAPGLFAGPLELTPSPAPSVVPGRFEAVPAGDSVLLRVHTDRPLDGTDTRLIVHANGGMEVLRPLPGGGDAIGFAAPAHAGDARFWLEVGGRTLPLGSPVLRTA